LEQSRRQARIITAKDKEIAGLKKTVQMLETELTAELAKPE
jgi:hypothetical protein